MVLRLADEEGTEIEVEKQTRIGAIQISPDAIEFPRLKYKVGLEDAVDNPQVALAFAQVFMQIDTNFQLKSLTAAIEKLARAIVVLPQAKRLTPTDVMPSPEVMGQQIAAVLSSLKEFGIPIPDMPNLAEMGKKSDGTSHP
jgi:hypothetical protein